MPRRPAALNPEDGPLAAFALELRALRDRGGPTAPGPEEISLKEDIHRSTIFAALAGKRVPSKNVLAALVKAWGGDQAEWTAKRTAVENALAATQQVRDRQRRGADLQGRTGVTWGELTQAGVSWGDLSGESSARQGKFQDDLAAFGADLRKLMAEKGLTAGKVAQLADLPRSTAYMLIAGRRLPRLSTLMALVKPLVDGDSDAMSRWKQRWLDLQRQMPQGS